MCLIDITLRIWAAILDLIVQLMMLADASAGLRLILVFTLVAHSRLINA